MEVLKEIKSVIDTKVLSGKSLKKSRKIISAIDKVRSLYDKAKERYDNRSIKIFRKVSCQYTKEEKENHKNLLKGIKDNLSSFKDKLYSDYKGILGLGFKDIKEKVLQKDNRDNERNIRSLNYRKDLLEIYFSGEHPARRNRRDGSVEFSRIKNRKSLKGKLQKLSVKYKTDLEKIIFDFERLYEDAKNCEIDSVQTLTQLFPMLCKEKMTNAYLGKLAKLVAPIIGSYKPGKPLHYSDLLRIYEYNNKGDSEFVNSCRNKVKIAKKPPQYQRLFLILKMSYILENYLISNMGK